MSKIFKDIKLKIDEDLESHLEWLMPKHGPYRILRKSVDARQKHSPHFVYTVEVAAEGETLSLEKFELERISPEKKISSKPIVVGSGPAGLFAAIRLVERGIPCLLFERGSESAERIKGINKFWRYGELDPKNNVCYGEGGAGLYSDGKLITRIKSPHIPYVLNRLVQFGAPAEIQWLSNPHVGSDKIRRVIPKVRDFLRANGCEIHFDSKVEKLIYGKNSIEGVVVNGKEYKSDHVILATGHSAEDMLNHLLESGVHIDGKSFAMGLRIEHPQKLINEIQYRQFADHPKLGSANYKLVHHDDKTGVGVYSFCMCPGGYVLSSGTEKDGLVCNGMSNFNRNSEFANAAIVVSIQHEKLFGNDLLGGMKLRRELETNAFKAVQENKGTKELPAQNLVSFLNRSNKNVLRKTSSPSGVLPIRLDQLLPDFMYKKIAEGLNNFNSNMRGFISEESQLYGVESRTSCPLRVTRDDETLESLSHKGLYPCGEGAGYAGGITSAAVDGIRCAEKIFEKLK